MTVFSIWNSVGSCLRLVDTFIAYIQLLYDNFFYSKTYDLDGGKQGPIETCQMYVDVLKEFKKSHPDFVGSRFIYAPMRAVDDETFNTYLPIMLKLQRTFPEFIAGFDVVGQEDLGNVDNSILIE